MPGPVLPGGDVMFTIESEAGTRRVPGKITGTRRGELEMRAQCLPATGGGGYGINVDIDLPNDIGSYDAETPAADPDDAARGDKAIEFVSAVYYAQKVGDYDRSNIPFEEHTDAWRISNGTPGEDLFGNDDFMMELTELEQFEEDSPWFDVVPHGRVTLTLTAARGMMVEIDPAREPITLIADF